MSIYYSTVTVQLVPSHSHSSPQVQLVHLHNLLVQVLTVETEAVEVPQFPQVHPVFSEELEFAVTAKEITKANKAIAMNAIIFFIIFVL